MKVYLEITLLPNADICNHFLWEKVFQQVHLGLVEMQDANSKVPIGLSLPEYDLEKRQLGSKLRLFAVNESILGEYDTPKWLNRLTDYVHLTGIRDVPARLSNLARYKRQQPKSSNERLARRLAKRQGLSVQEALVRLENRKEQRVDIPFINMNSQSSKRRFRLFILKEQVSHSSNEGFSCYGLSNVSTVPEF